MHLRDLSKIKQDRTLVNGTLFSIYAFLGRGIGFLLLIILANYIPPADYGKLSLFNTVVTLVGYVIGFSTAGYFSVSFFKESKETFHQDFTSIILFVVLSSAIVAFVFGVFGNQISVIAGIEPYLLWWGLAIAVFNLFFHIHQDYYRLKENLLSYGVLSIGNALLNAVVSLILVITFAQGWLGRINAQVLVTLFFGLIALYVFIKDDFFNFRIKKERLSLILFWGIPQIPHLATNWIRQGCDQYIINYNYSTHEVGLFSFALNLVSIITMVGIAFNSSNSVTIYKILADDSIPDKKNALTRNTRNIFLIYLLATIGVLIFSVVFVPLLLPKYVECIPYFVILSLYGFMVCLYFLFCNYLFYYNKTKNLMYITFGTSILHLILSLLLTRYSLYITSIIYMVSQTFCVFLVYNLSMKTLKKELSATH